MQTQEEVAQSIPLYYTTKSIEELHKDIMSNCNFLWHELFPSPQASSSHVAQKSAISNLKALFINSTKVFLAQYQMFWQTINVQHPLTHRYMSEQAAYIEASLRCMQTLSTSADYHKNAPDSEYDIYVILSNNFLYLAGIFICPYFDFMGAYGVINNALIYQTHASHNEKETVDLRSSEALQHHTEKLSQHLGREQNSQAATDVYLEESVAQSSSQTTESNKDVQQPPPSIGMHTEEAQQQPARNWAAVVGTFLNPANVPGLSAQDHKQAEVAKEKEEEEEERTYSSVAAGSAKSLVPGSELDVVMQVANSLSLAEKQAYLDDVESNLALQTQKSLFTLSDEEDELPTSKVVAPRLELDAEGFQPVKRRGSKKRNQKKRASYSVTEQEELVVNSSQQDDLEQLSMTVSPDLTQEDSSLVRPADINQSKLQANVEDVVADPLDTSTSSSMLEDKLLQQSSAVKTNNPQKRASSASLKKKKKKTENKPVNPIEELKSALRSRSYNKWNGKYLEHELVANELHDYVMDVLANFSVKDILEFVEKAKLPVKILLSVLQSSISDLSIKMTVFTKLLDTDDFVGFYLFVEQAKPMLALKSEYIQPLEHSDVNAADHRLLVMRVMEKSCEVKLLIEAHVSKLIENVTDNRNAEKLAVFAQHQNSEGQTPLMRLLQRQSQNNLHLKYQILHHLLPASNVFTQDAQQKTAFHYACMYYNPSFGIDIACKIIEYLKVNKLGVEDPFRLGLGPDKHGNSFLHNFVLAADSDDVLSNFLIKMMQDMQSQLLVALLHANGQNQTVFFLLDSKDKYYRKSTNLICQFLLYKDVRPGLMKLVHRKMCDKSLDVASRYTLFSPRGQDPLVELIRDLVTKPLDAKQRRKIFERILLIMEWRHALRFNLINNADDENILYVDRFVPHDELINEHNVISVPEVGGMLAHEALVMELLDAPEDIQAEFTESGAFGFYEANAPYNITFIWHRIRELASSPEKFSANIRSAKYSPLLIFLPPIQWKRDPRDMLFIEYALDMRDLRLVQLLGTYKKQDHVVTAEIDVPAERSLFIACQLCAVVHPETKDQIIKREYIIKYFKLLLEDLGLNIGNTPRSAGTDLNVLYLPVSLNFYELMELFFANLEKTPDKLREMMLHSSSMCKGRTAYQVARNKTSELTDEDEIAVNKRICGLFELWADKLGIELVGREVENLLDPEEQSLSLKMKF